MLGIFVPLVVGGFGAACSNDFDTSRTIPPRGTLGEELFGVVCDRAGGQSLHEDLTGASYAGICHPQADGTFSNTVDQSLLPTMVDGQVNVDGQPVPLAQQQSDRAYAVARMQTLAQDRTNLIAALDATFPDIQIAVKDVGNPDPTQSCNPPAASGEGSLHTELSNLLGRFQDLYNDGTIPQSTESMARVITAFKAATDAQAAWARFDARAGYRPITIALGAARPTIAYPGLRDFSNATLSLLSADSQPYQLNPQVDAGGNRIPVPGPAYPQLSQMMTVAHAELFNATADAPIPPLTQATDTTTGATVLNRPRTDLEFMQSLFYAQDPSFGGGTPEYIVQRDGRGYAAVPLVNGKVPAPFVDADGDGLPDVDALGQFVTSTGKAAPSPFFAVGATDALARDTYSRALNAPGGQLLYGFIDTSQTYSATLMHHLEPLLDSNPADDHETLMNFMAGAYVLFGTRDGSPKSTKTYADGEKVPYDAFETASSPIVDLLYALGQILADPTADPTLSFASTLVSQQPNAVARLVGDALYSKALADKATTAHIPAASTLWDDVIDVTIQIDQEPGLLADVIRALGDDASLPLATSFSGYQANLDRISYDRGNLNGPAYNFNTNNTSPPMTPVNRSKADTGANRSEMQRFLQAIYDTNGVTACNKQGAVVHAQGVALLGSVDIPSGPADGALADVVLAAAYGSKETFNECEVFKIDNLAAFYLDSIVGDANLYFRDNFIRNGSVGGLGAATVGLIEQSSAIGYDASAADQYNGADLTTPGFWDTSGSQTFRPKPGWLDRLVFFDIAGDSPTSAGKNYTTNHFLADLQGTQIGTSICPERIIADPCAPGGSSTCSGAPDVASDNKVHGLRTCPDGDWAFQRDQDATFVWEDFGFYSAITPLVSAFALAKNPMTGQPRHREDLFIALMNALDKHWQTGQGTASECTLQISPALDCTKDGADSYEPLLAQIFSSDMLPAVHDLVKILQGISVPTCAATDPTTGKCTKAGTAEDGVTVLANATNALVNPAVAKAAGLKDRKGNVTSVRNDGTTNPQVTPLYLVLETLNEIDQAFAQYAQANPKDTGRQAQWQSARSQLVDEFLGVNGQNTTMQTFADPSLQHVLPVILGAARSQLWSHCPPGSTTCPWASTTLAGNAATTIGGPTFAGAMDLNEAIRQNQTGRTSTEQLLTYLVDSGSGNDALAELLASSDDLIQIMSDDANMVPFYHVMSSAMVPTTTDSQGNLQRGVVDATTALLARVAGRAYDANNVEICANELDPDAVLNVALAHLVTPMKGSNGQPTETPLEVIVDTIADVNRASPGATTKLQGPDYANMANELSEFLLDDQRGLEQFYQIVRNGTEH
ncbi:MAG TPA: hypothetical protein VGL81_28005 [Polyangiaceae bacterium]